MSSHHSKHRHTSHEADPEIGNASGGVDLQSVSPAQEKLDADDPKPDLSNAISNDVDFLEQKQEEKKVWIWLGILCIVSLVFLCVYLMIIGSFYLTALWNPIRNFKDMHVCLCNHDVGFEGVNVGGFKKGKLNGHIHRAARKYGETTTITELEKKVRDNDCWDALVVPGNFSQVLIESWLGYLPGDYNNPILEIYDEGRQYTSTTLIRKGLNIILEEENLGLATQLHSGAFGTQSASAPIGVIVNPVYRAYDNLHPIEKYGWYFAVYISIVILWITCLLTHSLVFVTIHQKLTARVSLSFKMFLVIRLSCYAVASFAMGVISAFIIWWYDIPIEKSYGCLFLYFWLAGISFLAFMCPLFTYLAEGGIALSTVFLILQLATCDGVYARQSLPPFFFGVGPIFPFFHCVPIFRWITLGAEHHLLGMHIGVLFAWSAFGFVVSIPGWYWNVGEKVIRSSMPMFFEAFEHMSHMM